MDLNTEQVAVVRAIDQFAGEIGLPPLLLVALGFLENPAFDPHDQTGDGGTSVGIFQIHLPAHPPWGAEHWLGVDGTRNAMEEMRDRWVRAYQGMTLTFADNPAAFLLNWWKAAQGGSARITLKQCKEAVARAEAALLQAYDEDGVGMVEKPPILWFPAHPQNVLARPAGIRYEALVIHTTAGGSTLESLGAWFGGGNLAAGLRGSTHFGVDRAGRIGQFVSLQSMAIAHGDEDGATARLARENGATANAWAIGIEHLDGGVPGSVTPEQLAASAWLCAWLWETEIAPHASVTGAVLDRDHLLGHYELAPASKPRCPSWPESRFDNHLSLIQSRLTPPTPPPPTPPPPTPEPDPGVTIDGVKLGLIRKVLDDQWQAARDDLNKIVGA